MEIEVSIGKDVVERLNGYGRMNETVDHLLTRMMDCLDDSYQFWNDDK